MAARERVIGRVADHLSARRLGHSLRVAVDGITAAGKTTFARELAAAVEVRGRPAIHLSMDGYHHPRAHRHRQGRDSADGYYEDAYDFVSFTRNVLDPLGPGGSGHYRPAILDLATDTPAPETTASAPSDAVLVVDGSFLQRDLTWDEVVFLDVTFAAARARGTRRDAAAFGGVAAAEEAYERRYHKASSRYLSEVDPSATATILVRHDDVTAPELLRIGGGPGGTARLDPRGPTSPEPLSRDAL